MSRPPRTQDDWIRRMRDWGIRPSKAKGQNFLLDTDVVAAIAEAADAGPDAIFVEIGPGLGILTQELLDRDATVTAVELDDQLAPHLEKAFSDQPNFRLIHADATTVEPTSLFPKNEPYAIVANLPYSVGTRIVRHWLESSHPPKELVVMVQREVAERMTAGTGDLSLLGLAIRLYTEPEYLFTVPNDAFHPAPKVTSAVIRLTTRCEPLLDNLGRDRLFELASVAFQQRRKTLSNTLSRHLGMEKPMLGTILQDHGIDPTLRPQALAFEDWIRLADVEFPDR